ncbi:MAG: LLM class flavin-dependent oxidoreductase [Actinomycetota bacterium]|jgi:probable F420-dependent oxidoreductase
MNVPVALDLPGYGVSVEHLVAVTRRAEASGIKGVWVAEYFRNSFVIAALLARETSTIEVGTAVSWAFPRSPLVTALGALDLAEISGNRFRLGLGTQVKSATERWHGLDYRQPVGRIVDCVTAIRAAMRSGEDSSVVHEGPFYTMDLTGYRRVTPRPEPVPILLGAVGPAMLRAAVRVADGVIGHVLWSDAYFEGVVTPALDAVDRPLRVIASMLCSVSDDSATAKDEVRRTLGFYAATKSYKALLTEDGFSDEATAAHQALLDGDYQRLAASVSDRMLATYALAGTPAQVHEQLEARKLAADDLLVVPAYFGLEGPRLVEQMEGLVETFAGVASGS